MNLQNIEV